MSGVRILHFEEKKKKIMEINSSPPILYYGLMALMD